jgi:hypothetical protein
MGRAIVHYVLSGKNKEKFAAGVVPVKKTGRSGTLP